MVLIQLWINTTRKVLKYRMREIYISRDETYTKIYLIEDMQIVEKHKEEIKNPMIEGNIYVGKIANVLKGLKLAFVNINKEKSGILPFSDLAKKYNEEDILKILKPRKWNFSTSKTPRNR